MAQEWEYKVVRSIYPKPQTTGGGGMMVPAPTNPNPEDALNEAAQQGWEFMQAVSIKTPDGSTAVNHYLRRRFVQETPPVTASGPSAFAGPPDPGIPGGPR